LVLGWKGTKIGRDVSIEAEEGEGMKVDGANTLVEGSGLGI
jgi:hypothetical protein